MTDYAGFRHGSATFPLSTGTGNTLLRDADPALYYLLEFYAAIIRTHVQARLLEEAASAGADTITEAVAETLPLNPEPFLTEEHIHLPLLAAYRKNSKFENIGGRKHSVDELDVSYVLPALQAGEAECILPILKAVASVIDNRTEQGMDPAHTPTGGSAGDHVWETAGVATAEVKGVSYGSYAAANDLFYPCVVLQVELKELSTVALTEFDDLDRLDASVDVAAPHTETVEDVAQISVYPSAILVEGSGQAILSESGDVVAPEDEA